MNVDKTNLALEELKLLQAAITRQEGIRFQVRGWNIALLTALTITFVASNSPISKDKYLVASIGLAILFLWLEVVHRVAEDRAIRRSEDVEAALRDEIPYDGPQIGRALSKANNFREQFTAMNNVRMYLPYTVQVFLSIFIGLVK